MAEKITRAEVDTELKAANMEGEGVGDIARANQAQNRLLRWADLPPDRFEADYLHAAVLRAASFFPRGPGDGGGRD